MNNFQLVQQVSRERQLDLQRESAEEQRWRVSPDGQKRPTLLSRLLSLFTSGHKARPASSVVATEDRRAPVSDGQLNDCLAC
jgi:hypothetical protein